MDITERLLEVPTMGHDAGCVMEAAEEIKRLRKLLQQVLEAAQSDDVLLGWWHALEQVENLPNMATCTESQTAIDWGRVEQAEAIDHVTPAIDCECKGPHHRHRYHEWENGEDGNPERCSKCGLSFMRFIHICCP